MDYVKAFVIGGTLCLMGQILIDKTKLTPARILVCYVVIGVILGALGIYQPIADFAGAGATVPLTGFGNLLATGVKKAVDKDGGPNENLVFLLQWGIFIALAQNEGAQNHKNHQGCDEHKMLPGEEALCRPGIAAKAKKFFHGYSLGRFLSNGV